MKITTTAKIATSNSSSFALLNYSYRHWRIFMIMRSIILLAVAAGPLNNFWMLHFLWDVSDISIIQWPRHAKSVIPFKFFSLFEILLIKCKILKSFVLFLCQANDDALYGVNDALFYVRSLFFRVPIAAVY